MQTYDRAWLPTSQGEKTFLFSLSLLLMVNTTVVLLLLAGELPVLADLRAKSTPALVDQAEQEKPTDVVQAVAPPTQPQWTGDSQPVVVEADQPRVVEVAPRDGASSVSTPVLSVASPAVGPDPIEPVQQVQPEQDDPPVTFFGVGIE